MKKPSLSIKKIISTGIFAAAIFTVTINANAEDLQVNTKSRFHMPFLDRVMNKIDHKSNSENRNGDWKKNKENKEDKINKNNNNKALYGTVSSLGTNSFTLLVESKKWNNGTTSTTTNTYTINVLSNTKIFENATNTTFSNINLNEKVLVKGTLTATNTIEAKSIHLSEIKIKTKAEIKNNKATSTVSGEIMTKYTLQERQDMFNKIVNYFKNLLGL